MIHDDSDVMMDSMAGKEDKKFSHGEIKLKEIVRYPGYDWQFGNMYFILIGPSNASPFLWQVEVIALSINPIFHQLSKSNEPRTYILWEIPHILNWEWSLINLHQIK